MYTCTWAVYTATRVHGRVHDRDTTVPTVYTARTRLVHDRVQAVYTDHRLRTVSTAVYTTVPRPLHGRVLHGRVTAVYMTVNTDRVLVYRAVYKPCSVHKPPCTNRVHGHVHGRYCGTAVYGLCTLNNN